MGDGDAFVVANTALKILILEDDALAAAAFAAALRDNGHEVVGIADSAQDGLAKARRDSADLALVDIALADGRTGLAAARTLRDHFTIPTVLISGEAGLAAKADAVRAVGYIAKPADADDVARAVGSLAESPALRRGFTPDASSRSEH